MPTPAAQDWIQEFETASKIVDKIELCFGKRSIIVNRQVFFTFSNNRTTPDGERDRTVVRV